MSLTPSTAVACRWFEIPSTDLERAVAFYEALFDAKLIRQSMEDGTDLAIFPHHDTENGGCVVHAPHYQPCKSGVVIYLNCQDMAETLSRSIRLGGRLITPKTMLPGDLGCYAHIEDCEGNRIGLHAAK